MISSTSDFTSHVADHAGSGIECAERASRAVLIWIGSHLDVAARELVAEELPPALAAALLETEDLAVPIEEHVLVPGVAPSVGKARELIASVCRVLVEELSDDAVRCLEVISGLAPFLGGSAGEREREPHLHARTLAEGSPGSRRPLSESDARRAQPDSVTADNPHGDSKLSTGAPRRRDTLAEARPSRRAIIRSHR